MLVVVWKVKATAVISVSKGPFDLPSAAPAQEQGLCYLQVKVSWCYTALPTSFDARTGPYDQHRQFVWGAAIL